MKFKVAENSLFSILLRSAWWVSFAVAAGILLVSRVVLPERWFVGGAVASLPFFGIGIAVALRQLRAPRAADVSATLQRLDRMSWREFATALEASFRHAGYESARVDAGAADLELVKSGRKSLVACRRWKAASTGIEPLRELDALRASREADEAVYVAIGGVTEQARRYAAEKRLRLIEGTELAALMRAATRG